MPAALDTHTLEIICLFLLIAVVLFAWLARRLGVPYPILLVLAGLGISFIPHVPRIPLNPDLVFFVFLPPLLYASSWQINWREFQGNLVSISMLAIGLVGFTVLGFAFFAEHFITALDLRSGFLLGAIVAATDAVAATSIARSLGLAPRLTTILEGESLLNDATGLLALEFGIGLLFSGQHPSVGDGLLRLLWLIAGGVGVGLLLGYLVAHLERWIAEGPMEMAVSLIVPYLAYLSAEGLRSSGVLAVVVCALYLSRKSATYLSPSARLEVMSAWKALDFILNGVVFLLIGLQLPYVVAGLQEYSVGTLILYGVSFSLVLIALRMAWVYPGAHASAWIRRTVFRQPATAPDARSIFVIGWTGMRGVLALAAAFSLPQTLSDGTPFLQRNLLLFLTFSVILVTLVGQGLSLPLLIRRLGLNGNREAEHEELAARRVLLSETLAMLEEQRAAATDEDLTHDIDDLLHRYRHRLEATVEKQEGSVSTSENAAALTSFATLSPQSAAHCTVCATRAPSATRSCATWNANSTSPTYASTAARKKSLTKWAWKRTGWQPVDDGESELPRPPPPSGQSPALPLHHKAGQQQPPVLVLPDCLHLQRRHLVPERQHRHAHPGRDPHIPRLVEVAAELIHQVLPRHALAAQRDLHIDIPLAQLRLLRVVVIVRPHIVACPVPDDLHRRVFLQPASRHALRKRMQRRRAHHLHQPDLPCRLHRRAPSAVQRHARIAQRLRQAVGVVLRHPRNPLRIDRRTHRPQIRRHLALQQRKSVLRRLPAQRQRKPPHPVRVPGDRPYRLPPRPHLRLHHRSKLRSKPLHGAHSVRNVSKPPPSSGRSSHVPARPSSPETAPASRAPAPPPHPARCTRSTPYRR
jgi:CPA1 family monovalent cation:H+ antiporter